MDRFLRFGKKALFPGAGWVILIVLAGIVSQLLTFGTWLGDTPLAYCAYSLSFYALVVASAAVAGRAGGAIAAVRPFRLQGAICRTPITASGWGSVSPFWSTSCSPP